MKRISAVILVFLFTLMGSQITDYVYSDTKSDVPSTSAPLVPLFGYKAVYVTFFTFLGEANSMRMQLDYSQTDPSNTYPVIFTVLDENGNEIMIRDYMQQNSLTSISYYDLFEKGVEDYYKKITNKKLDLDVVFLRNPAHTKGVWEVEQTRSFYQSLDPDVASSLYQYYMVEKLKTCGDDFIKNLIDQQLDPFTKETVFLNFMAVPIKPGVGGTAPGNDSYNFMGNYIQQMVAILAHELAHTTLAVGDMGYSNLSSYYYGYIDGKFMGYAGSQTGPYCFMFHNGGQLSPYALNAIQPIHTQLLYHQGYFDSQDYVSFNDNFVFKNEINKANIRLKSVRDELSPEDITSNIKRFAILPVATDLKDPLDTPTRTSSGVEAQHFLIEYRNGKGYDNIACLGESGNSKGILVSHINNSDYNTAGNYYSPNIDIEIATPYPKYWSNEVDLYRDPDSTSYRKVYVSPGVYEFVYDEVMNGTYYNGRECPDWLDDYNYNQYDPQGGPGAWPSDFGECSLPSDFFNATDRNKFTPTTRPSSLSFKMKDTHIGVFIDHIEDYYVDLRIYRNYWSIPLTTEYLAVNNEGKSVVGLQNNCFFGEGFSVDPNIQMWLGNGTDEMEATLISGTNMTMKENSLLMLANNTALRMENSKLTFLSGSKYQPNDIADIELIDSELNFNDGFIFCPLGEETLNRIDINVSGNSSIYHSNLELINNSVLRIKENSELVLKEGTNLNIPSGASLILEANASLIIEKGANLTIDFDAVLQFGDSAEVSLKSGSSFVMDGAINYGISIYAEYGSSIYIRNAIFTNIGTGVRGTPSKCVIQNSTFEGCRAGVSIEGCDYLEITDNTFTGIGVGVGLALTQSYGYILRNTVENFDKGIMVVSCSPLISNNIIRNNRYSGIYTVGLNSIPQLVTTEKNSVLNNIICDNGQTTEDQISLSSQISVLHGADIFMKYGWNNVFSNPINQIPEIPCLLAYKLVPDGVEDRTQLLFVQGNYWGSNIVNNNYFLTSAGYGIVYEPYSASPFAESPLTTTYPEQDTKSFDLLIKAIEAELEGKYDKALKTYEIIIEKYTESEEAKVAFAKLSDSYTLGGLETVSLIDTYDQFASSEDETVNKKFFKEMTVYAKLKSKRYDEAINVSQEMKNEADTEEEQILCDIDIALANIMKNGKSKGNQRCELDALLSTLIGSSKSEPAGLESVILPEKSTLYQNYPNPFNPLTHIKFDLAKSAKIRLSVYNISGQIVAELANGIKQAGCHNADFDGSKLNSGVYYYTLEVDGKAITKKMVLTK